MAIAASIGDFLKRERVPYRTIAHPVAYTAQEEAAVAHVPGRHWAKTVVCVADDQPIQVVVAADRMVDLERLRELTRARVVRLGTEDEIATLYPECERGAMPPFGPLYGQRVYVDMALVGEPEIVFNAGTHADAIGMHYNDFAEMVNPVVGALARPIGREAMTDLASKQCVPCRGGVPPLKSAELEAFLRDVNNGWQVIDEHHLEKEYRFKNFREALDFAIRVGELAEEQRHHPNISLAWGKVRLEVWTHKIDGLTESDFVFAAKADRQLETASGTGRRSFLAAGDV